MSDASQTGSALRLAPICMWWWRTVLEWSWQVFSMLFVNLVN